MPPRPSLELIVLRAPASDRRHQLARQIAAALSGAAVVVPLRALHTDWIISHNPDRGSELEVMHRIGKLVVVSYLRSGYHVILEDTFRERIAGEQVRQEDQLAELLGLARTLPVRTTVVEADAGRQAEGPPAINGRSAIDPDITLNLTDELEGSIRKLLALLNRAP